MIVLTVIFLFLLIQLIDYLYCHLFNIKIQQYLFDELQKQNWTAFSTCLIAAHRNVHMRATTFNISAQLTTKYTVLHNS